MKKGELIRPGQAAGLSGTVRAKRQMGFTLMELLITVAIVGILATVAIPSYQGSIRRGNRAEAKAALLDNAQFLERYFTENNRYSADANGTTAVTLPITTAPREGTAMYNIAVTHPNPLLAAGYVLTATPINGGRMAGDECGVLSLNQWGQKGVDGNSDGTLDTNLVDPCWNR